MAQISSERFTNKDASPRLALSGQFLLFVLCQCEHYILKKRFPRISYCTFVLKRVWFTDLIYRQLVNVTGRHPLPQTPKGIRNLTDLCNVSTYLKGHACPKKWKVEIRRTVAPDSSKNLWFASRKKPHTQDKTNSKRLYYYFIKVLKLSVINLLCLIIPLLNRNLAYK